MNNMIKRPMGLGAGQLLKVAILALTLTLTACGGGGSSTTLSQQIIADVKALIATGTAANLETALDKLTQNQDNLSASDFEALMDQIAAA